MARYTSGRRVKGLEATFKRSDKSGGATGRTEEPSAVYENRRRVLCEYGKILLRSRSELVEHSFPPQQVKTACRGPRLCPLSRSGRSATGVFARIDSRPSNSLSSNGARAAAGARRLFIKLSTRILYLTSRRNGHLLLVRAYTAQTLLSSSLAQPLVKR